MSTTDFVSRAFVTSSTPTAKIILSTRVNEHFPPLHQILSAHDVARLTRRHRWVLYALTILARFPKQQRIRGHAIGWRRSDIVGWLADRSDRHQDRPHGRCSALRRHKPLALEYAEPGAPAPTPTPTGATRRHAIRQSASTARRTRNVSNGSRSNG